MSRARGRATGSGRLRGTIALALLLAGALPAGLALFGVAPAQVILLGAVGATICALVRARPTMADPPGWPETVVLEQDHGARRDIARLTWSVSGADQQVGRTLRLRLRQVAVRRLARRGIDLTGPEPSDRTVAAATAVLGADAFRVLDPDLHEVVGLARFSAAVRAVEALEQGPGLDPSPSNEEPHP